MSQFSSLDGTDSRQWIHRYSNIQAELVGVIRGRGSEKTSVQSCFAPCFFYYSFPHISCCYTCKCNEKYVGRRKGALVQRDSWEFQFVNPLFQQQMVLHTTSFLKSSSSSSCTSLYIGCFFLIFSLDVFGMKCATSMLSLPPAQISLVNICAFSIFWLIDLPHPETSECCFLILFVP